MAVTAGTYVILAAGNTGIALDLIGAWDTNGNRVRTYSRTDSDAQLVRLIPEGDNWYVQFILTGKNLDRKGNGTSNGTAVQQWSAGLPAAQTWRFVEDGNTVTYGGESYPSYKIKHPTLEMSLDIKAGKAVSGSELHIWKTASTDSQRWILVPQNAVADGTYQLFTALKTNMVVGVSGSSTALNANVCVDANNGGNNQAFVVSTDETSGLSAIASPITGYVLNSRGAASTAGTKIIMWEKNNTPAQQWVIEPEDTTATFNGQTMALYHLRLKLGENMVADVANGGTSLTTKNNLTLRKFNASKAQLFGFVPSEYLASDLPVPSSLGISLSPTGESCESSVPSADGAYTVYPRFECAGEKYQLRYRSRSRAADMDSSDMGEWGEWQSIFDGASANSGWGDAWGENCVPTRSGNTNWADAITGELSASETDLIEYQYEVRRFAAQWGKLSAPAHGNSAIYGFKVGVAPTADITGLTITSEGVMVSFASSLPRSGNTVKVSCEGLFGEASASALKAEDSITVPYDRLLGAPEEGSEYTVALTLTTVDGVSVSTTGTVSATIGSGHSTALDYSCNVNGAQLDMALSGGGTVYLEVVRGHGNRLVPFETDESGRATVIPPLNTPYKLWLVKPSASDDSAWATKVLHMDAIEDDAYHITSTDGTKDITVELNEGKPPVFEPSYSRDITFATTTGRERNIATMGTTTAAKWSLTGVFYGTYNGTLLEHDRAFDTAAHMGFCIFRSPTTFWAQAAIASSSIDMSETNIHEASFSFTEVEL